MDRMTTRSLSLSAASSLEFPSCCRTKVLAPEVQVEKLDLEKLEKFLIQLSSHFLLAELLKIWLTNYLMGPWRLV